MKTNEEIWREDFEALNTIIGRNQYREDNGLYCDEIVQTLYDVYIAARKKAKEEVDERIRADGFSVYETNFMLNEITSLKNRIKELEKPENEYKEMLEFISSRDLVVENKKLQDIINGICDENPYDFSQYCMSIRYGFEKEILALKTIITETIPYVQQFNSLSKVEHERIMVLLGKMENERVDL